MTLRIHVSQQNPILHIGRVAGHLILGIHNLNMSPTCGSSIQLHTHAITFLLGCLRIPEKNSGWCNTGLSGRSTPSWSSPECPLEHVGILISTHHLFLDKWIKPISVLQAFPMFLSGFQQGCTLQIFINNSKQVNFAIIQKGDHISPATGSPFLAYVIYRGFSWLCHFLLCYRPYKQSL